MRSTLYTELKLPSPILLSGRKSRMVVEAAIIGLILRLIYSRMNPSSEPSFEPVPPDFAKGIFFAPHNFSDPENK